MMDLVVPSFVFDIAWNVSLTLFVLLYGRLGGKLTLPSNMECRFSQAILLAQKNPVDLRNSDVPN